jgi:hypothetical protein
MLRFAFFGGLVTYDCRPIVGPISSTMADEQDHLLSSIGEYGALNNGKKVVKIDPSHDESTQDEKPPRRTLVKTQHSFYEDAKYFKNGSIPHSIVLASVIGTVCGVASFVYYTILFWLLEFVWHTLPEMIVVGKWPEWAYVLWIPLVGFLMAIGLGLTVVYMGEPGDLPYTVKCVHDKAYVAMSHVMPMVRRKIGWFAVHKQ